MRRECDSLTDEQKELP